MRSARTSKVRTLAGVAVVLLNLIPARGAVPRVGVAPAAGAALQGSNFNLEGKITQHTPGKLTVSTEDNIIFHVTCGEKTEIMRQDGSPGSEKDLLVGVTIKVEGDLAESGEIAAQKIAIEAEAKH